MMSAPSAAMPIAVEALLMLASSAAVGSAVATAVIRRPTGTLLRPARSSCGNCGTQLGLADLVPVASWVALRGRCRHCGARIEATYTAIEIASIAAAAMALLFAPLTQWLPSLVLGWLLIWLSAIDIREQKLPTDLVVLLAIAGLVCGAIESGGLPVDRLVGGAAGFSFFALVRIAYRALRGAEGMGGGDVKLLAALGCWVGWQGLAPLVLIASLAGIAAGGARLLVTGTPLGARIAFGPCLALAAWIIWLAPPRIMYGGMQ